MFVEESFQLIAGMLEAEKDLMALRAELTGLGFLYLPEVVPLTLPFVTHPDAGVRFAVTSSLGSFSNNAEAVDALLKLMEDGDPDDRDWATFAIGTQSEVDTHDVREALALRRRDRNTATREKAIAGLANEAMGGRYCRGFACRNQAILYA